MKAPGSPLIVTLASAPTGRVPTVIPTGIDKDLKASAAGLAVVPSFTAYCPHQLQC